MDDGTAFVLPAVIEVTAPDKFVVDIATVVIHI